MNVYVPLEIPVIVVVEPLPWMVTLPGVLVSDQLPLAGSPDITTLPVDDIQVGWVIKPGTGGDGTGLTVREYVATAASQGDPRGLFVVTVIVTTFPTSP